MLPGNATEKWVASGIICFILTSKQISMPTTPMEVWKGGVSDVPASTELNVVRREAQ
jgi:hypothetical protein